MVSTPKQGGFGFVEAAQLFLDDPEVSEGGSDFVVVGISLGGWLVVLVWVSLCRWLLQFVRGELADPDGSVPVDLIASATNAISIVIVGELPEGPGKQIAEMALYPIVGRVEPLTALEAVEIVDRVGRFGEEIGLEGSDWRGFRVTLMASGGTTSSFRLG